MMAMAGKSTWGSVGGTGMTASDTAEANDNVYLRDLPGGLDEISARSFLDRFGTIVSMKMLSTGDSNWAAALVRFSSVKEATYAIQSLHGHVPENGTRAIQARYANKPKGGACGKGDQGIAAMATLNGAGAAPDIRYNPYVTYPPAYDPYDVYQAGCKGSKDGYGYGKGGYGKKGSSYK